MGVTLSRVSPKVKTQEIVVKLFVTCFVCSHPFTLPTHSPLPQVLTFFASLIVLMVNIIIEKVLKYCSTYEKHNSEDARGTSTFLRMFILKYINTTLVFFINNNNTILYQIFGVRTQTTTEFTADWFNTIGVTIILVQLGDVLSSHGDKVYKLLKFHRDKRISRTKELALTQDDLNMAQMGPEFEFAFSYAQMLSTFFCCFTFSTGIPILYAICAANYFIYYFVEKYLFIHLYRIPPHFSNNVGKRATAMLPYAFIIHLFMSIWVLSNTELFQNNIDEDGASVVDHSDSPVSEKITGRATFPLFVFLVAILALRIATHVYKGSAKTIKLVSSVCAVFLSVGLVRCSGITYGVNGSMLIYVVLNCTTFLFAQLPLSHFF